MKNTKITENNPKSGEKSFDVTITIERVISHYIYTINDNLKIFSHYDHFSGTIDFLKLRRFLITTCNTLVELVLELKKTAITDMLNELTSLSKIYDSFRQRSQQTKRAFYDLFLNQHDEFVKAEKRLEANKMAIVKHVSNISIAETAISKLEAILKRVSKDSQTYPIIQKKLKKRRTIASDEIHHKKILETENIGLVQFIEMIINENEESFTLKYKIQAKIIDKRIVDLLNKVAFKFEDLLWREARDSKVIRNYFKESKIQGKLCSLTYLKYYLQSLDNQKLSQTHKDLVNLIPYLEMLHRRSVLYFSSDIDNALRLKSGINSIDKYIEPSFRT